MVWKAKRVTLHISYRRDKQEPDKSDFRSRRSGDLLEQDATFIDILEASNASFSRVGKYEGRFALCFHALVRLTMWP
jgi:hypothetical protein